MSDYYEDEYYDDHEDEDPEPDCWSQHFSLFKRDGKLYVHELTLGGFFGGAYGSFGYPDITLSDHEFPLEQAVRRLQRVCKRLGAKLAEEESIDIGYLVKYGLSVTALRSWW